MAGVAILPSAASYTNKSYITRASTSESSVIGAILLTYTRSSNCLIALVIVSVLICSFPANPSGSATVSY